MSCKQTHVTKSMSYLPSTNGIHNVAVACMFLHVNVAVICVHELSIVQTINHRYNQRMTNCVIFYINKNKLNHLVTELDFVDVYTKIKIQPHVRMFTYNNLFILVSFSAE